VEEGGAGVGKKKRRGRGSRVIADPRSRSCCARTPTAVNPEDRSASAAMDVLNVDHHLFGRMPEQ
jgi:hypothetical protein